MSKLQMITALLGFQPHVRIDHRTRMGEQEREK